MIGSILQINTALAASLSVFLLIASAGAARSSESDSVNSSFVVALGFERFSAEHTCEGVDVSPQIVLSGRNASVVSLAIIMDDPDAPSGTFTHWTIWNIPPVDLIPGSIPKNASISQPFVARQGMTDMGETGYSGPCPPPGKPHRYFFRIYGLDSLLDLPEGAQVQELRAAMLGHVQQSGEAMASFGR